ncbi:MAG: hypothetical protein WAW17_22570 [Rhodococcus sp. (in: high G+C Gram-positive bacteria)]|uniref:hypothetical protein n=1 Tax=Rhodococcus sp. TaxID=1831 RepID=UPI003BB0699E
MNADACTQIEAPACSNNGFEDLDGVCPKLLLFAVALDYDLFHTACTLPLSLDALGLLLQATRARRSDRRCPGLASSLDLDQTAVVQYTRRDSV